jgi:hypothetical protein
MICRFLGTAAVDMSAIEGRRVGGHQPSTPRSASSGTPWSGINRLKRYRAVAARYEGTIHIAAINEWL